MDPIRTGGSHTVSTTSTEPVGSAPAEASESTMLGPVPLVPLGRPQVAAAPALRRAAPVVRTTGLSGRARAVLGATLLALLAWEFRESLASSGLAARVPGLTLYDTPVAAAARNVPLREGKPPPIR